MAIRMVQDNPVTQPPHHPQTVSAQGGRRQTVTMPVQMPLAQRAGRIDDLHPYAGRVSAGDDPPAAGAVFQHVVGRLVDRQHQIIQPLRGQAGSGGEGFDPPAQHAQVCRDLTVQHLPVAHARLLPWPGRRTEGFP
ncbi:hypothetical protein GCM10010149_03530 [Nonomuraea roseoviolacea subsp. roseoviolacea]